jgi:hypothetical protein
MTLQQVIVDDTQGPTQRMALRYLGLDGYRKSTDVVVVGSTHDCHYLAVTLATKCMTKYVGFPSHTQAGDVMT